MSLLLFAAPTFAYELSGDAWSDFPLEVRWTGAIDGVTRDAAEGAVEGAVAEWAEAMPCGMEIAAVEDADAATSGAGVVILLGDPDDEVAPGVVGVSASNAGTWRIVVDDAAPVVSDDAIEHDACDGEYSLQGFLAHALGNVLGLGDSCSEGDACTDPDARAATMYWAQEACDTNASTLGDDDRAGIAALYGDTWDIRLSCSAAEDDGMTVTCIASYGDASLADLDPTWDFGDRTDAVGVGATHTYRVPGPYDIGFCVSPDVCESRRCVYTTFAAAVTEAGGDDTAVDTAPPDDSGAAGPDDGGGCGCDHAGSGAFAGWLAIVALLARRKGAAR